MYIKKYFKKRMIISITTVLLIAIVIFGSSYALFMDVKSNNEDQVITVGDLVINFNGGSAITIDPIEPMEDQDAQLDSNTKYSFTINNVGNLAYCYTISVENNPAHLTGGTNYNPSAVLLDHNYIRYTIEGNAPATLGEQANGVVYTGTINPGKAKLFNLRIWVADATEYNLPNEALGSEVHLNINVDGKACGEAAPALAEKILDQSCVEGEIQELGQSAFASAETGAGCIYKTQDDDGWSYYFRGNHNLPNNVLFAGYQWKIIRLDGNGNIRMIYNGECPSMNCAGAYNASTNPTGIYGNTGGSATALSSVSAFNDDSYDNTSVGYKYGSTGQSTYAATHLAPTNPSANDSRIKIAVDTFYNNLSSDAKELITDAVYCGDRQSSASSSGPLDNSGGFGTATTYYAAYYRLVTNKAPSLLCQQVNDRYTLKAGLITADEAAFAGGLASINNNYYLRTNDAYWTMSPSVVTYRVFGCPVSSSGSICGTTMIHVEYGVRPVVALDSELIKIFSGDGSLDNPYIVE